MVATFTDLRSSAQAVSYYEEDGYYAKNDPEHRKASFWFGSGAAAAGLRAHVHPARFEEALRGEVPGTGIRLGRMREGEREHRPGWDLTFSAPKSVSLEALVVGDRRVIRAHDDAVRATLAWVEAELLETRGWAPATRKRPRMKAHGMMAAGFRHLISRNLDPQLHTHCVIANMTRDGAGRWKSVDPTRMGRAKRLIGACYRNELALRLEALGMAVVPSLIGDVPGFELAGYERSFLDAFSGRRREILAHLKRLGLPYTPKLAQMAALRTRRKKMDVSVAELVPAWRAKAEALGLGRRRKTLMPAPPRDPLTGEAPPRPVVEPPEADAKALRTLRRTPALPKLTPGRIAERAVAAPRARSERATAPNSVILEPETGALEAVGRAVAHVAERRTAIPETEIRARALGHAPGRHSLADIDAAIARLVGEGELVETVRKNMDRAFVTDRTLRDERKILETMRAGRGEGRALADGRAVEARLAAGRLTDGQKEAVRAVLLAPDPIVGVQGHAGSGKTTMLRTVAELLEGARILGLAPSASAARVLEREAGIEAWTLQRFLVRYETLSDPEALRRARDAFAGAVLAVDEASMIGTARMEALLRTARRLGVARVALTGDTAQLRAVEAGQPFHLLQRAGMRVARMPEVVRQRDPDLLAAVGHAREGAPGEAVRSLGPRVREEARENLGREAARAWLAMPPRERADAVILVPTHAIRRQASRAVREGLEDEGVLHGPALEIERLVSRGLTRALAADVASYEPGDTVVFHRSVYGRRSGDVCTVLRIDDDGRVILVAEDDEEDEESGFRPSGNASTYLQLYGTETIEIRAGDRVRWTRNRPSPGRRSGQPAPPDLVNGEEAEVLEIEARRVRFRDRGGRTFAIPFQDPQLRHLDHAYASTVHAAQGRTARTAIAVLDADGATDQAMFHVEVSRASEAFLLLTDDREALVETLERRPTRDGSALEALGIDPAQAPAIDPETFAELAGDWRTLKRESRETGTIPFFLPGYRDAMARAAAFSVVEEPPTDMRGLADAMLDEHAGCRARAEELRGLVEGLRNQVRCWPEIGWVRRARRRDGVDDVPGHGVWREESAALAARARTVLRNDGVLARHLDAMPDGRAGLLRELEALERVRLMDDAERFESRWAGLRRRARGTGVPEIHDEKHAEIAALGERLLRAEGIDPSRRAAVEDWRTVHAEQTRLADEVRALPGEVSAWRARRADELPLDANGEADPALPACRAWRADGEGLKAGSVAMLRLGSAHRPHLDALPGAREAAVAAVRNLKGALRDDERAGFLWLAREVRGTERESGIPAFHLSRYGELVDRARALAHDGNLPADLRKTVDRWISHRDRSAKLVEDVRTWPGQCRALQADRPRTGADIEGLAAWRKRATSPLARARAMRADGSAHAPHLAAMPDERARLDAAARRLDDTLLAVDAAEMNRLAELAEDAARETGLAVFETARWYGALRRARALDARDDLPPDVHEDVQRHLGRRDGWEAQRERIGSLLELAARVEAERERPGETVGKDWLDDARDVLGKIETLTNDVPRRELAGHLRALRAAEGAIDGLVRSLADRIAAAEAERGWRPERKTKTVEEDGVRETARERERGSGRGLSM